MSLKNSPADRLPLADVQNVNPGQVIYGPSGDMTWDEADPTYSVKAAKQGG